MIIDAHTHLIDPPYDPAQLTFTINDGQIMKPPALREQVTPKNLLKDMDKHNINKAIVIASDALSNETLSLIVKENPKRLNGFAYINPLEADSPQQLEHAVKRLNLTGLKLVPDFQGFSMGDPKIYPLIEAAVDLAIPVMVHSAPGLIQGHYTKSLPAHFDKINSTFPELTLIISHMSYPLFLDLLTIVPREGVYVDTSTSLPWICELFGVDFTSRYIQKLGSDSVIFGSDWWGQAGEMEKQLEWINRLKLTRVEKEMILGGNISKMLAS